MPKNSSKNNIFTKSISILYRRNSKAIDWIIKSIDYPSVQLEICLLECEMTDLDDLAKSLTGLIGVNLRVNETLFTVYCLGEKANHNDIDFLAAVYDLTHGLLETESEKAEKAEKDKTIKKEVMKNKNIDMCFGIFIKMRFEIDNKHHSQIVEKVRKVLKDWPEATVNKKR